MRLLSASLIISTVLLTACTGLMGNSPNYVAEENANQFVGQNITAVLSAWGKPDQAMHTAENTSYYVYTTKTDTGANANTLAAGESPIVTPGGKAVGVPIESQTRDNVAPTILCTTTFKTNNSGTILWAKHQGSSCLGKWVNTTEK